MVNFCYDERRSFVTEVTVDLEDAFEAANHQTLEVQFRRDTQAHVQIQRVMMVMNGRAEAPPGITCIIGFYFHAAANHELTDAARSANALLTRFIVEIRSVTLAVTRFDPAGRGICPAAAQSFSQQTQLGAVDRELTGFGLEQLTAGGDDVAEVPLLNWSL